MNDLVVDSSWKRWEDERPEVGEYFFAIGKEYGTDEYVTISQFPKMLMMYADPLYEILETGGYEYNGKYSKPYPIICDGFDMFSCGNTSTFEIEYWINVNDLLPKFLKK